MRRRLLVCAGILGGAIPVFAQSANQPAVSFQESVVVTAALEESTPSELSAAVTVIEAAEIAERQSTEVFSLLTTVPGLATTQLGSPGKTATVFARGANSNHTLVLWNGVPLNDPYFGGFDWSNMPTSGVERIEVVRGPFSALWGSDAIGGVVNVLTRREPGLGLDLEGGENGYGRLAAMGGVASERLALTANASSRRGDGEVDNDFFDSDDLTARGAWKPTAASELALLLRANHSEIGIPFDFFGTPAPERTQDSRGREVALPFEISWSDLRLETQLALGRTDLEFSDPNDPFAHSDTEAERQRARGVLSFEPDDRFWLAGGADWQRNEASSVDAFGTQLDGQSQRTWSGFAQTGWRGGDWRLDAGLRHDDNDAFGSETTGKLGAVWQATAGLRARASYGEGFHAPTLADLYYPGFSNPDLEPEQSESVELGVDGQHGDWRWGLAAFSTEFEDLIQFDFLTSRPFNTGRARSRGLEAEVAWHHGGWSLRWNGTRLDAEDRDTREPLLRRPRESTNLLATWRPGGWTLHGEGRYVGERLDVGGVMLPSYATASIGAAYRLANVAWLEPRARIENVFDREYEEAAGFPAPGRRFVVGVALRR